VSVSSARVNPFVTPGVFPLSSGDEVYRFHRALPGYARTPLHSCPGLAASLGLDAVHIKDEGQRFGLQAFKALGASWALHRIRQQQQGPMTVSTATAGNHGRGVAWAARQLGIPAVIFIPSTAAPARVEKIREQGARVELVPGTYDDAVRRCAEASAASGWQVVADIGYEGYLDIPNRIVEGYSTLFREIDEQLAETATPAPTVLAVQVGVGSLLHAAVDHYRAKPIQPAIMAAGPVGSNPSFASIGTSDGTPAPATGPQNSIMAVLSSEAVSITAWPTIRRGVDVFVEVTDQAAADTMRRLGRPAPGDPAIVAGASGSAGLAGLIAVLQGADMAPARRRLGLGPSTRLLAIVSEGATDPEGYRRVVGGVDSGLG
jgi:diaminopropionate ammonia-lyase